jgi:hypothetical protein
MPASRRWHVLKRATALPSLVFYAYVGFESALCRPARPNPRRASRAHCTGHRCDGALLLQTVSVVVMPGLAGTTARSSKGALLCGPTGAALMMIGMVASVGATYSTLISAAHHLRAGAGRSLPQCLQRSRRLARRPFPS